MYVAKSFNKKDTNQLNMGAFGFSDMLPLEYKRSSPNPVKYKES